jgi:hypothetical protein
LLPSFRRSRQLNTVHGERGAKQRRPVGGWADVSLPEWRLSVATMIKSNRDASAVAIRSSAQRDGVMSKNLIDA